MASEFYSDDGESARSFCEHCDGQRFDRARVLRALRRLRQDLRTMDGRADVDRALVLALNTVRALEIPHLDPEEEDDGVIH
jgi:hypothetical protein